MLPLRPFAFPWNFQPQVRRGLLFTASSLTFALGSCAPSTVTEGDPDAEVATTPTSEIQVVTTFLPITQFTKAVVGDRAEVVQLIPANVGPHDYQAKPTDAQALVTADVLVKNGLEMEFFLDDLIANADNADLVVIDTSIGIATLSNEEVEGHGHDDHGHGHDDHDHGHDHGHEDKDDHGHDHADGGHHHHGEFNPHIWLDPKRAVQQVENIRDGLIAVDPDGEPEYTANAAVYIEQLQALDQEIAERLAPYAGQTFVAFHDFAPYFAESYGLEAEFLVDVPEDNPSPEDVKRVMDTVTASNLKTLLTEPQAGEDSFSALAGDLGVAISVFDPIETGGPEALEPEYYFIAMRQNLDALVTAFEGETQSWLPQQRFQAIAPGLRRVPTVATVPQRLGLGF